MNKNEIEKIYKKIKKHHDLYLIKQGVKLPALKNKGRYTKNALCLILLADKYPKQTRKTKTEITKFIRKYYRDVNDIQQARHLRSQYGWFIESGNAYSSSLRNGEYKLITLEKCAPDFKHHRNISINEDDWKKIKKKYNNRCATCNSKEGKEHYYHKGKVTKLQKGHKDPGKKLTVGNTIPQCQFCNSTYQNDWIFKNNGRIKAIANPEVVLKSSDSIQKEILAILGLKFARKNHKKK